MYCGYLFEFLNKFTKAYIVPYNSIGCGYTSELPQQVNKIQTVTHNICLYKETDKKFSVCILKTLALLDCAFVGVLQYLVKKGMFLWENRENVYLDILLS